MEDFIVKLVKLGLSELEAKVYINLLKKNNFSATEIASLTDINRTQTYDILSKLVKKGLCTEIRGNKEKYIAVDPQKVLSALEKDLEEKKQIASELSSPSFEHFYTFQ
ncbi:MAG: TrmB family transcriptional regulator [Methanotrichaceae archaeon]